MKAVTSIEQEPAGRRYLTVPGKTKNKENEDALLWGERIGEEIFRVAKIDSPVLIQGEVGVGKEQFARAIHCRSARKDRPFIKVNCSGLSEKWMDRLLFGYEKGAFAEAYRAKPGKFELANRGTMFLDEITETSRSLQARFLKVLQDGWFLKAGGNGDFIKIDVRVLVATRKDLEAHVRTGHFREDLYDCLSVTCIQVPTLRERRENIPILAQYYLQMYAKRYGKNAPAG